MRTLRTRTQPEQRPANSGDRSTPVVELIDVERTFSGPPTVRALDRTNLLVRDGDYLSIIGPSGSGKSTLLHILGLLDRPTAGSYRFDGVATETMSDAERSALRGGGIGFVFQAFHLLPHRCVLDNVKVATLYSGVPRADRDRRAREALAVVNMTHRLDFFPTTLSGGERQRVAIARALVAEPRLLLADEPTGNLDSANSVAVLDVFDQLHREGLTLVVITHDAAVSTRAERRVRIVDGHVDEVTA